MTAEILTAKPASTRLRTGALPALCLSRTVLELKQFVRNPEAAVFTFSFPVMMLVIFASIFRDKIQGPPGESAVSLSQYYVAGMVAAGALTTAFQTLAISISIEQHEGLLKRLGGTPLPKTAYFAGKIGLVTVATFVQLLLMIIIGLIFYDLKLPTDPGRWLALIAMGVMGVASCALLGIAFTRIVPNGRSAPAMTTPIAIILQFISGVFVRFDQIPGWLQGVASVFPLRWMAQGLRYVFLPDWFKSEEVGGAWDLPIVFAVLAAWLVAGFILATVFFRWDRGQD